MLINLVKRFTKFVFDEKYLYLINRALHQEGSLWFDAALWRGIYPKNRPPGRRPVAITFQVATGSAVAIPAAFPLYWRYAIGHRGGGL